MLSRQELVKQICVFLQIQQPPLRKKFGDVPEPMVQKSASLGRLLNATSSSSFKGLTATQSRESVDTKPVKNNVDMKVILRIW